MSRGTRAQREAGYRKRRREDGERDALAGRPQSASDPEYVDAYERAQRGGGGPAITDGFHRSDPIERLGHLVRNAFGRDEGNAILTLSLDRIPTPGAPEDDYRKAVLAVVCERHPEWAAEHGLGPP